MRLMTGRATDQGRTRAKNEDASLVDDEHTLFAVADGMGGHRGGEVASHTAIEALRAAFAGGASIDVSISRANDAVLARAAGNDELTGMGTTMTAVTVGGRDQLLIGHVGDSRAYLLRNGEMVRITDDHSLVEELVREGRLTPEQAEAHPQRAIVTRALGVDADVEVDTYEISVEPGDRVLICSDGLTTMVRERDIERFARSERDPQRAADAARRGRERCGRRRQHHRHRGRRARGRRAARGRRRGIPGRRTPDDDRARRTTATIRARRATCPAIPAAHGPRRAVRRAAARRDSRRRGRRARLVRAQLVLRRCVAQRGRHLQGCARRRARLGSHGRSAHRHPGRRAPTARSGPRADELDAWLALDGPGLRRTAPRLS